jgi:deoxyribodipyrimidine photolyase
MSKAVKLLLIVSLLSLAGCVKEESGDTAQKLMPNTVEQLQEELASTRAQLASERSKYIAQIKELKDENIEIQNVAMKTIMTMLEKQIAYDNRIQQKLKDQLAAMETEKQSLETKVKVLESKISTQDQAKVVDAEIQPVS